MAHLLFCSRFCSPDKDMLEIVKAHSEIIVGGNNSK